MQEKSKAAAVLYAAKSSPDEKGSIAGQLREAHEWAEANGYEVTAAYFEEDVSAFKDDRGPELANALDHAELADATLIAQHSDRLARGDAKQARHLVEIALWAIKAEVSIHCLEDPSTFQNLVMAVVMGDRNMEDSRRKAAAVKAGLERRRKRGEHPGGLPGYGYRYRRNAEDERERVIDPERAPVVERIYAEYLAGHGYTAIAQGLNADGVRTLKGGRWGHLAVRQVLMNPIYAGLIRNGEELLQGRHEAIVERETWDRAQQLREAKTRTHKRGRLPAGKHLFRKGFLRCEDCEYSMEPRTWRNRNGSTTESYVSAGRARYRGAGLCETPAISRAKIDGAVYSYFQNLGLDMEATKERLAAAQEQKQAEAEEMVAVAEGEAQEARERLERVKDDYLAGEITAAEWRELKAELEPQAAAAEAEVGRMRSQLEEAESEAALSEIASDVLAHLSEIRAQIAKEVTDVQGAAAVRATLMRLFDGFVLHRGQPPHKRGEITKVTHWLEPRLSESTVAGYDEKLKPDEVHTPLAQAENNFSSLMGDTSELARWNYPPSGY